jgi:hypothetical protein
MTSGSDEKIKLYAVIGLLIVAALVGYFRFGRKPKATVRAAPDAAPVAAGALFDIPALPDWLGGDPLVLEAADALYVPPTRDLFAPHYALPDGEGGPDGSPAAGTGRPRLSAVMMGGQGAVAVINGQVLRVGESLGDYRVVDIQRGVAVLQAGTKRLVLRVAE